MRDEPHRAALPAHEREEVRRLGQRRFSLPFGVRDDVVDGREGDVELAGREVLHLVDGAGCRRQRDLHALLREEAFLHPDPQRPVEPAGEDDDGERDERLHWTWIFALFTTSAMRAVSLLMKASNAAGVIGIGSGPSTAGFSFTSGLASAFVASAFSRSTIAFGVPAGASIATQNT